MLVRTKAMPVSCGRYMGRPSPGWYASDLAHQQHPTFQVAANLARCSVKNRGLLIELSWPAQMFRLCVGIYISRQPQKFRCFSQLCGPQKRRLCRCILYTLKFDVQRSDEV